MHESRAAEKPGLIMMGKKRPPPQEHRVEASCTVHVQGVSSRLAPAPTEMSAQISSVAGNWPSGKTNDVVRAHVQRAFR